MRSLVRLGAALGLALLCALGLEPGALADSAERKAAAHFREGARHYRERDFQEALVWFRASLKLSRRPPTLLNIAQCYRQLGQAEQAIEHYKLYLEEYSRQNGGESSPHRAEIEEHIKNLSASLPKPEPAPIRTKPPAIEEGRPTEKSEPRRATVAVARSTDAAPPEAHPAKRRRLWTWVVGASAIAVGATGLGVGLSAHLDYLAWVDEGKQEPRRVELVDSLPRRANASYALYGIAGALAVTSVVLFFVEGRPASTEGSASSLNIRPLTGSTWGLSLGGSL